MMHAFGYAPTAKNFSGSRDGRRVGFDRGPQKGRTPTQVKKLVGPIMMKKRLIEHGVVKVLVPIDFQYVLDGRVLSFEV